MIYMACLRISRPQQVQEDVDSNGDLATVRRGSTWIEEGRGRFVEGRGDQA